MTQAAEDANTIHSTSQPETTTTQTLDADQISAVIWYTITKTPQATWHNFARQIMKAMQEPEFLWLIVLLYNDTHQATPVHTWQQREALLAALKQLEN